MIAVCLVQGGVEPHFFSERLYSQLCGLQTPAPALEDIEDLDFRGKLRKVSYRMFDFFFVVLVIVTQKLP